MATDEWPKWPADDPGVVLSDFVFEKPLNEAFKLLHGGASEFREKMNTANHYEGFAATPWEGSAAEAAATTPTSAPPPEVEVADLKPGMTAKRTFVAVNSMGRVQTTELQRVEAATPSREVVLESYVATTGKYGDRFRPMIRRTLTAEDDGEGTRVRSLGTVVYIGSVNGMVKGLIQKGALGGMKESCAKLEALLGEYAAVRPYGTPLGGAPAAAAAPDAAAPAGAPEASPLRAALEQVAGEAAVRALYPWAAFLHAALAHLPFLRGVTPEAVLAAAVAGLALGALRLTIELLQFAASAGAAPRGALAWAACLLFRFLHVPSSPWEVVTTVGLALAARAGAAALAAALPAPPSGGSRPPSAAGAAPVPEDSDANAGVQYDGYGAAISGSAGKNYVGGGALGKMDEQSEAALGALRAGLLKVGSLAKHRGAENARRHAAAKEHVKERRDARLHHVKQKHQERRGGRGGGAAIAGGCRPDTPESNAAEADAEAHLLSPRGYAGPELPPAARAAAVVESIFENERLQPFRGFGHTWPGHFLPSDRVLHWSVMDPATRADVAFAQELDDVAPPAPPGWRWVEASWTLDLTGVFSDSTDNEGWSYGLDFPWVVYPFQPGAGRKKLADFVRRRRWLRTRVPVEGGPGDGASQAQTGTQSGTAGGSAEEGASDGEGEGEGEGEGAESAAPAPGGGVAEALQQGIALVAVPDEEGEGEEGGDESAGAEPELPPSDVAPAVKEEDEVEEVAAEEGEVAGS